MTYIQKCNVHVAWSVSYLVCLIRIIAMVFVVKNEPGTGGIFDHEKSEVAHKVMDHSNRIRRDAAIAAYEKQFEGNDSSKEPPRP